VNTVKLVRRSSAWPVAIASLACLVGSAQALAAAPTQTHSVTVRYGDLDLATSAGATVLYDRIETAARMTCDYPYGRFGSLSGVGSCKGSAIADAVASVNNPLLSTIYTAHTGAHLTAMLSE
jgi:UrcA family protein